ncbi:MAG: urate hydroxylase PuuD [Deltaproteobacteria bacterium]
MTWLEAAFRWIHVVAGITWIGHLYFFNFVNAQLVKTYDADSKKKVLPELMPRALYWFRWGAAYTWVTGFLLLGMVYYMEGGASFQLDSVSRMTATGASVAGIVVVFFIYDALWKLVKNEKAAATVSFVLFTALAYGLSQLFSGRAVFIQLGGLLGTIMAMNVWMRIWPAQKKIIGAVKGTGPAPDAAVPAMAGLRSKHNTYMSLPLVFFMVSNHYSDIYNLNNSWAVASAIVLVGWGVTKLLYLKSASPVTAAYGAPAAAAAAAPAAAAK